MPNPPLVAVGIVCEVGCIDYCVHVEAKLHKYVRNFWKWMRPQSWNQRKLITENWLGEAEWDVLQQMRVVRAFRTAKEDAAARMAKRLRRKWYANAANRAHAENSDTDTSPSKKSCLKSPKSVATEHSFHSTGILQSDIDHHVSFSDEKQSRDSDKHACFSEAEQMENDECAPSSSSQESPYREASSASKKALDVALASVSPSSLGLVEEPGPHSTIQNTPTPLQSDTNGCAKLPSVSTLHYPPKQRQGKGDVSFDTQDNQPSCILYEARPTSKGAGADKSIQAGAGADEISDTKTETMLLSEALKPLDDWLGVLRQEAAALSTREGSRELTSSSSI